ncbi:MAG: hypothetical protein VYA55_02550 [Pseudomonadota bacterium]|nr:hypothetical protein [Pseudomonadota bacterium]
MKICLTGMHRSGTSLFASYLQDAGFVLGDNLRGPRKGNILGHFEDLEFQNINIELLDANKSHKFLPWRTLVKPKETRKKAEILLSRKQPNNFLWKDPRSALFLDFWNDSTPNLKFIFMLRHPDLVYDSLIRRGTDKPIKLFPFLAYYSWYVYNSNILDFYQRNPEKCAIIDIDKAFKDWSETQKRLSAFLEVPLPDIQSTLKKDLFNSQIDSQNHSLYKQMFGYRQKCLKLYDIILTQTQFS